MVKKKLFEIWLHLDVHLQEIVEIVVCNSDIGFKKIGESLYTTKILASKKLLKFMPPRFWLRRNWWKLLPPEERMFHSLLAPLAGYHHSCDVWRTLYISFSCYLLSNDFSSEMPSCLRFREEWGAIYVIWMSVFGLGSSSSKHPHKMQNVGNISV